MELTKLERETLKLVADNPLLFDTLKDIISFHFNVDGLSTEISNELLGQKVRARIEGIYLVEQAFNDIEKCSSVPRQQEKINRGR